LLLGLQIVWIGRVILEGNIVDKANENNVGYIFLSDAYNEFHRMDKILLSTFSTIDIPEVFFIKNTNND
jgi:hypothetical protein